MAEGKYTKALRVLDARRQKAKQIAKQHQEEVEKIIPQIKALQNKLISNNAVLSLAILKKQAGIPELMDQMRRQTQETQAKIAQLLQEYGYTPDYLTPQFTCPICEDVGYVSGERCGCLIALAKTIAAKSFTVSAAQPTDTFETFSLDYYPDTPLQESNAATPTVRQMMEGVFRYCREYAQTFTLGAPNVLMTGGTGLGKTHLSRAIADVVVNRSYSVLYCSALDLFRSLQDEYFSKTAESEYSMQTVLDMDLLIIDDLGAEFSTNFNNSVLYNIVNSRLNAAKPTIISTNLTFKELEQRYSQRIASRFMTLYQCLKFSGTDIRQQLLKKKKQ